jgi:hypothetical protein
MSQQVMLASRGLHHTLQPPWTALRQAAPFNCWCCLLLLLLLCWVAHRSKTLPCVKQCSKGCRSLHME